MKKFYLLMTFICILYVDAFSQKKLATLERADFQNAIPIAKIPLIDGSGDTTYMQQYAELENREDSICIVDGGCLFQIPNAVENVNWYYDNNNTRFVFTSTTTNGEPEIIYQHFNPRLLNLTPNPEGFSIEYPTSSPWETSETTSFSQINIDNGLSATMVNDSTLRIYIGRQDNLFSYAVHDSIDVPIVVVEPNTDNQILSITGTDLTISNGNTIVIPQDGVSNWDVIPNGIKYSDFVGIGTSSPSQNLDVNGNVRIRDGLFDKNNQDGQFGQYLMSTDDEIDWRWIYYTALDFTGTTGLSDGVDNINDADSDPMNEIQDTTNFPNLLEFVQNNSINSNDGYEANTDNQILSITGTDLTISNGNTIVIPQDGFEPNTDTQLSDGDIFSMGYIKNPDDADSDSSNEYNTSLTLSGTILSINDGGGAKSRDLSSLQDGNGYWNKSAIGIYDINGTASILDSKQSTILNDNGLGGTRNTWIGRRAGQNSNVGSRDNIGIANDALFRLTDGDGNVALGNQAGNFNTTGSNNFFLGSQTGANHTTANNCTYIGSVAGNQNNTDNRLYISGVGYHVNPLIYGEFDNRLLAIKSHLRIDRYSSSNSLLTFNGLEDWEIRNDDTHLNINKLSGGGRLKVDSKLQVNNRTGTGIGILMTDVNGTLVDGTLGSGLNISNGQLTFSGSSPWTVGSQNQIYRITSGSIGNVGINKTSPAFPLSVEGSVWIDEGTIIDSDNQGGFDHQFLSEDPADDEMDWRYVLPTFSINQGTVTATMQSSATTNQGSFTIPDPEQHVGRASMSSFTTTSTSFSNMSISSVSFETGDVDVNSSLERVTATSAGYYRVSYQGQMFGSSNASAQLRIKRNNVSLSDYQAEFYSVQDGNAQVIFNDVIYMNTNQYLQLEARIFGGSTVTINQLYLSLEKI